MKSWLIQPEKKVLEYLSHWAIKNKFLLDYLHNAGSMVLGYNFLQLTNTLAFLAVASLTKKLNIDNLLLDC